MSELGLLLFALFLVFLNGFFVASEFAIVKLRQTQADQLRKTHGIFGRILQNVRSHLDAYLSACQLGITLASLGLGWVGEPAFARLLEPLFEMAGIQSQELIHGIAFVVAFSIISFLHIVIGELAPKSIAIRHPLRVSLWLATPLYIFYWIMFPFIYVLNGSANLILNWLGVSLVHEGDDAHSSEEIKQVLMASHHHGELGSHEAEILGRALEFSDLSVVDLMIPVSRMITLDINQSMQGIRAVIARHRFSRYPVVDGRTQKFIGLIHIKDLFAAESQAPDFQLRKVLRELPMASRDMPAMKLFRRFRAGYPHLAAVTDESNVVIGFVTLENLLQALVGRIDDEFKRDRTDWRVLPDGSYEGRGWFSIYSLERLLGREIEVDRETNSVGGMVIKILDRVPKTGDKLDLPDCVLEVLEMAGPRIERLRVSLLDEENSNKSALASTQAEN